MGLVEVQERIGALLRRGASLEQVERDVITPSPFTEEQRAALWLFAHATARRPIPEAHTRPIRSLAVRGG